MKKGSVLYYIVEVKEVRENLAAHGLAVIINHEQKTVIKNILNIEVKENPTAYIAQLLSEETSHE